MPFSTSPAGPLSHLTKQNPCSAPLQSTPAEQTDQTREISNYSAPRFHYIPISENAHRPASTRDGDVPRAEAQRSSQAHVLKVAHDARDLRAARRLGEQREVAQVRVVGRVAHLRVRLSLLRLRLLPGVVAALRRDADGGGGDCGCVVGLRAEIVSAAAARRLGGRVCVRLLRMEILLLRVL